MVKALIKWWSLLIITSIFLSLTLVGCGGGLIEPPEEDEPEPQKFFILPGHYVRGLNMLRNNQSPYIGPSDLQNKAVVNMGDSPFVDGTFGFDYVQIGDVELLASAENHYYYGMYISLIANLVDESETSMFYRLCRIDPNGVPLACANGGLSTSIHEDRVVTANAFLYELRGEDLPGGGLPPPIESISYRSLNSYSPSLQDRILIGEEDPEGGFLNGSSETDVFTWFGSHMPLSNDSFLSLERSQSGPDDPAYGRIVIRDTNTLQPVQWADEIVLGDPKADLKRAAAFTDGHIYYLYEIDFQHYLVCTDSELHELWQRPVGDFWFEALVISNEGRIFIASSSGVFAFDPDGTQLWSNGVAVNSDLAVTPDGDVLFVGWTDVLALLSGDTGEILWTTPLESNVRVKGIIVDAEGKIFLSTYEWVYIFDAGGNRLDSSPIEPMSSNPVLRPDGVMSYVWWENVDFSFDHNLVIFE